MATPKPTWGFDIRDIDTSVRPQDDFYHYAAGTWLKKNPVPANEPRWGSFDIVRYNTEQQLHAIVTDLEKGFVPKKGTPERMIRDFFVSGMDMKRRNALGLKPVAPLLKSISEIETLDDVLVHIAELHRVGVGVFWGLTVDQDSKESTKYILHLFQDGLGMPESDYYLKEDAESNRVRTAYTKHVEAVFKLMGYRKEEAHRAMEIVLAIETRLAAAWMTKEDRRDAEKTYHKKTLRELNTLSPTVDWKEYFKILGTPHQKAFIVMQPDFFGTVSELLERVPLEDLKIYLAFHSVNDYAGYLTDAFARQQFSFYGTTLSGMKQMKPLWRRTLRGVNSCLGELLGRIYVQRHFSSLAKRKMNALVDDLFEAYEIRLKGLSWMSPTTKKKALKKLHAMNRKIGYPNKWRSYKKLVIRSDDYAGNAARTAAFSHGREMRKLSKPIDRDEWFMYPQTVNAYFAPNLNDIAFPAAILQPPFFNMDADDAINYGAIGSVIGHEITHGFDDQGSKYDEKGNLKSWWTPTDRKRFEKHAKIIEKQYDGYKVADNIPVSGKLTLGENIADHGGITIAFDAYQIKLKKTGRVDIDGFTPEQRFFLGVSVFDRENARDEFEKTAVLTDPHSPGIFRVNGPFSNMDAFYRAFAVKPTDKMYRKPAIRTTVW